VTQFVGTQSSGDHFSVGTTDLGFRSTDPAGNSVECHFAIVVNGSPPAPSSLGRPSVALALVRLDTPDACILPHLLTLGTVIVVGWGHTDVWPPIISHCPADLTFAPDAEDFVIGETVANCDQSIIGLV